MMTDLIEDMRQKIKHAKSLYHRLVLVVGFPGAGKTDALREIAKGTGAPLINVNLEISRCVLNLAERQRPLQVQPHLERLISDTASDILLLDNIEFLFDVMLRQDPLRLLQGLSRNRTLAVAWSGSIKDGYLRYAAPDHPEHRRYPLDGLLVASVGATVT